MCTFNSSYKKLRAMLPIGSSIIHSDVQVLYGYINLHMI